jgi:shikimate kinase
MAVGRPHIALVGMMGCGKTTIGRILAAQVDRAVIDLDAVLVEEHGMAISEMFTNKGEQWFRDAEAELLARCLAAPDAAVVSVGGGAVLRDSSRAVLRDRAAVVWLRATVDTLVDRNGGGGGRPLLAGNPVERIRQLTAERAPIYADTAHSVVDVDELSPGQSAECVRAAVLMLDPSHWVR